MRLERRVHRFFARWVYRISGFTHWSSGPGNYTFDDKCPWCRAKRLLGISR